LSCGPNSLPFSRPRSTRRWSVVRALWTPRWTPVGSVDPFSNESVDQGAPSLRGIGDASGAATRIVVDSFGTPRIEARRSEAAGVADSHGKVKEAVVGGRDVGVFKAGPGEARRQAGSILVCRDLRESSAADGVAVGAWRGEPGEGRAPCGGRGQCQIAHGTGRPHARIARRTVAGIAAPVAVRVTLLPVGDVRTVVAPVPQPVGKLS